jgi:hypothetical protein
VFVELGSAAVVAAFADGAAASEAVLPIPNLPELVGAEVLAQAFVGPSPNPAGIETSSAIALVLGTW